MCPRSHDNRGMRAASYADEGPHNTAPSRCINSLSQSSSDPIRQLRRTSPNTSGDDIQISMTGHICISSTNFLKGLSGAPGGSRGSETHSGQRYHSFSQTSFNKTVRGRLPPHRDQEPSGCQDRGSDLKAPPTGSDT